MQKKNQSAPTRVTTIIPLVLLPFIGFALGVGYQRTLHQAELEKELWRGVGTISQLNVQKSPQSDQRYVNANGFSFELPASFRLEAGGTDSRAYYRSTAGVVMVSVADKPFDPMAIEGLYVPITNPEKIAIGDRVGYRYPEDDGGVTVDVVVTALGNKTLFVRFASAEEQTLASDAALKNRILSSFVFNE